MLILFEYRAARHLIKQQFPGGAAAAISKISVDDDVISLDGRDPLRAESEIDNTGRIRVRIRKSTSSLPESSAISSTINLTPRPSNLSNAEIFSVNTPPFPNLDIGIGNSDFPFGYRSVSPHRLSGYASSDAYSLQPTPRASNFNELDVTTANTPTWVRSPMAGKLSRQPSPSLSSAKMVNSLERQERRDVIAGTYCTSLAIFQNKCFRYFLFFFRGETMSFKRFDGNTTVSYGGTRVIEVSMSCYRYEKGHT